MICYTRFNGTALEPASEDDADLMARLPMGPAIKTEAKVPRDLGRHRHTFLLFARAHRALPEKFRMSFDTFRQALTIDAGYYDEVQTPAGKIRVAQSLAYGSMDDATHRQFHDDLIKCLCERWIPGLDNDAFTNEILECL